jgi:hypothetical protein
VILRAEQPEVGGTYLPVVRLPSKSGASAGAIARLEDLSRTTRLFANNPDAYHYLLSELIDNIYQHSGASNAFVMAQFYPKSGLMEASVIDDGITIRGSLERGIAAQYEPTQEFQAILDALNGESAKSRVERGFGLGTSVGIVTALGGEALVVSGRGAVISEGEGRLTAYPLDEGQNLPGTLVSIRLSEGDKKINIYDHLER